MLSLIIPTAVLSVAAVLSLVAVFAVRAGVFAPVTETPLPAGVSDPSTVTLAGSSELVRTVLSPRQPEWQTATLHSLTEVEDLLDCLEAHGVATREVSVVNSGTFAVRWR